MGTEPDKARKEESPPPHGRATILEVHGIDDAAIIPKGALDPVYEAKARVLNRAVRVTPQREARLGYLGEDCH